MEYGKILGMIAGWAIAGPIGLIIGGIAGVVYDVYHNPIDKFVLKAGNFGVCIVILSAAVIRVDGRFKQTEIDFVKKSFTRQFGKAVSEGAIKMLNTVLQDSIKIKQVCFKVRTHLSIEARLQLLHYLFKLAYLEEEIKKDEIKVIALISKYLGIDEADLLSIKAMCLGERVDFDYQKYYKRSRPRRPISQATKIENAYTILCINKSMSDSDIKTAYRNLAKKHHPDKVASLGKEYRDDANERFQKISEAYELVKKEKGIV